MSFINWGSESPEQREIRRRLEQDAIYEQAVRLSQAKQRAVAGGSATKLLATLDWLVIAPIGDGTPLSATYANFDSFETSSFAPIVEARRIVIRASSANAHVHDTLPSSNLTLDLYDSNSSSWVTVWSTTLQNPNHPADSSADFSVDGISATFSPITVTKIRFTSSPGSDQTYHDWDADSTFFDFYKY